MNLTKKQLAQIAALPDRVRVALAKRCIERVFPAFPAEQYERQAKFINECLQNMSRVIDTGKLLDGATSGSSMEELVGYTGPNPPLGDSDKRIMSAAYYGEHAACCLPDDPNDDPHDVAASAAASSISYVLDAGELLHVQLRSDVERDLATAEGFGDVPGDFGPMWPDGAPTWPRPDGEGLTQNEYPGHIIIEVDVPDDVSDEELAEKIAELARHATVVHRSVAGYGLKIDSVQVQRHAEVEA